MVAAAALNTIADNDQIVVAVRLVYQEWEDTKGLPGLLVVKATRQDGLTGNLQTGRTISDSHAPAHPGIPIRERNDKIGKILVDIGSIAQRDVLAAFSDQLGIPLVRVAGPPPASPEIEGLTERVLRQSRALPMALVDSTLKLRWPIRWTLRPWRRCTPSRAYKFKPYWRPSLDANLKHYPSTSEYAPRVPRLRSERASKFVKDQ